MNGRSWRGVQPSRPARPSPNGPATFRFICDDLLRFKRAALAISWRLRRRRTAHLAAALRFTVAQQQRPSCGVHVSELLRHSPSPPPPQLPPAGRQLYDWVRREFISCPAGGRRASALPPTPAKQLMAVCKADEPELIYGNLARTPADRCCLRISKVSRRACLVNELRWKYARASKSWDFSEGRTP